MKKGLGFLLSTVFYSMLLLGYASYAQAALTLQSGDNATTTPSVATSITGFQIVGPSASTTPVRLRSTHGTLSMTSTTGLTFSGPSSGTTVSFNGTVANINNALATLKYSRASTGTDTLEVSLVEPGEVFFPDNGHLYKFITGSINALNARTQAATQSAYGVSGYLATITSQAENDFVAARLQGDGWVGGSDEGVEGQWRWVTGPEAGTLFWTGASGGSVAPGQYANWSPSEPNDWLNGTPGEDCIQFYISTTKWNDLNCSGNNLSGYVVEFGTPGNLPTVVATTISVVTADVPAVATLSPVNGATLVSSSTNLVITLSKAVNPNSGNILIKKVSDDSTVETIDVTSGAVTGGGTTQITINPTVNLPEGTQLYVIIPNGALRDASSNNFAGITESSEWRFTTSDTTAPIITNVVTEIATTSAIVTWNTNELASSKVWFQVGPGVSSSTPEINTSTRVTEHEVTLSSLIPCIAYTLDLVSRDATGNTATSTTAITTLGCPASQTPTAATTTTVSTDATSTIEFVDDGRTFTVEVPEFVTASSSSIVIQIKALPAADVLSGIGDATADKQRAALVVFEVTALIDGTTILESFNTPVTITYTYTDADIQGLDESTITLYHYRSGTWSQLDACSVNTGLNQVSCTAPHFSVFALYGTAPVAAAQTGSRSVTSVRERIQNLNRLGLPQEAARLQQEWPQVASVQKVAQSVAQPSVEQSAQNNIQQSTEHSIQQNVSASCKLGALNRTLRSGMKGEDVQRLQKYLNCLGFNLARSGPGSLGNETDLYSVRTYLAVKRYQEAYSADILAPLGHTTGTGTFGPLSYKKAQQLQGISE